MKSLIIVKVVVLVVLFLAILTMESCATRCGQQRRYWNTHRAV